MKWHTHNQPAQVSDFLFFINEFAQTFISSFAVMGSQACRTGLAGGGEGKRNRLVQLKVLRFSFSIIQQKMKKLPKPISPPTPGGLRRVRRRLLCPLL